MKRDRKQGQYLKHISCTKCPSSDGMALYKQEDGTTDGYCWVCEQYDKNPLDQERVEEEVLLENYAENLDAVSQYQIKGLPERGIPVDTCERFGVRVGVSPETGEIIEHYYPYYIDKELVGYKKRVVDGKKFEGVGRLKGVDLFGKHLCGNSGKMLVITEGECDAMAAYQMFKDKGKNYRVCSLPNGANAKAIKANLEWLEKFETLILAFDQDEPGKKNAKTVSELFSPGKCKAMSFSEKDPNALYLAGKSAEFFQALSNATAIRPDGIVSGSDTWERLKNRPVVQSVPYPDGWDDLNKKTYGLRLGELDTWTSGSGMGKTQVLRELQYHLLNSTDDSIGVIALEEALEDSVESLMALHLNKRIQLPDVKETVTDDEKYEAWLATSGTNRLHYYDHFGSVDDDSLISKIKYLARGLDCKYIFLDHLSIVVSEFADQGGERERIDTIMTKLKNLTQELGIWLGLVVHLRKVGGGLNFEEGAVPSLDDLRGSGSIKQLSNSVYALSRNQQAGNDEERNTSHLHVLKCRFTGRTGEGDYLFFDDETGRMVPTEKPETKEEINEF